MKAVSLNTGDRSSCEFNFWNWLKPLQTDSFLMNFYVRNLKVLIASSVFSAADFSNSLSPWRELCLGLRVVKIDIVSVIRF